MDCQKTANVVPLDWHHNRMSSPPTQVLRIRVQMQHSHLHKQVQSNLRQSPPSYKCGSEATVQSSSALPTAQHHPQQLMNVFMMGLSSALTLDPAIQDPRINTSSTKTLFIKDSGDRLHLHSRCESDSLPRQGTPRIGGAAGTPVRDPVSGKGHGRVMWIILGQDHGTIVISTVVQGSGDTLLPSYLNGYNIQLAMSDLRTLCSVGNVPVYVLYDALGQMSG
ncbi:hypothetical protein BC939DRAFT_507577 [Gamsiella multidivaricata]|uniref:uncharacterized protein n=1 Tax=Gamsiella multidivaricata TaxID=101098 RepID=UPI00221F7D21|nr:uncharacterized protein BC939DRAFT_507577 [Gamsiella multidivaricata]KAI7817196.1 hypothetical protein BC939DRAFT_507577 [Gamsiella multidivaricata]